MKKYFKVFSGLKIKAAIILSIAILFIFSLSIVAFCSTYHKGNDAAYQVLFRKFSVGAFIADVRVVAIREIDDGFLAKIDYKTIYIVSKGIKGSDDILDGMELLIEGQIIGSFQYMTIGDNMNTVPKVKASKIVRAYK